MKGRVSYIALYSSVYNLTDGTTAYGSQVRYELSALGSSVNSVINEQIPIGANISDDKLATISTGQKVNLTALVATSQAQGDIIYASSASAMARLGAGTVGQLLFTGGAAANPSWAGTEETAVVDTTQRDETSASYVDVTSETITYTSLGGFAMCQYTALLSNSGAPLGSVALTDGSNNILDEVNVNLNNSGSSGDRIPIKLSWIGKVAAGSFTFKIRQKTASGRTQNLQNDEVSAKLRVIHFG